jgi:hypothetical protein
LCSVYPKVYKELAIKKQYPDRLIKWNRMLEEF